MANNHPREGNQGAQGKGHAPPPIPQLRLCEGSREEISKGRTHQHPQHGTPESPDAKEAPLSIWSGFGEENDRGCVLTPC